MFTTTEQLEEALSRPTARDCEALAELEGDLLILGAGGKMGPSLAVRACGKGCRKPESRPSAPICWTGMRCANCRKAPT